MMLQPVGPTAIVFLERLMTSTLDTRDTPPTPATGLSRRRFLLTCGTVGAGALAAYAIARVGLQSGTMRAATVDGGLKMATRSSKALGAEVSMIVLHEDERVARRALEAAFGLLAHVERVMSIYLPESEVSRLNRDGVLVNPDPLLVKVLEQSMEFAKRSGGAFDVTVQPLWTIYAEAAKSGKLPSDGEIELARGKVDWQQVEISSREIRLSRRGMAITLNGIAQGFAADRAMEALKAHGIENALVNTGEIAGLGKKADGSSWTLGIQHPRNKGAYLGLAKVASGRCVSTSGDYEMAFTEDKAYNHIFDPKTGRSPLEFSSVTVVAPCATDADALSTAIFVLGMTKGAVLAKEFAGTEMLLVSKDGRQFKTGGFPLA